MTPAIDHKSVDTMDRSLLERRQLLNSVLAITAISTQFLTLLLATMTQDKAVWNDAETSALVDFFWTHRAESGDGGTFKDASYNAVAEHIAPHWTSGPIKNAKRCKTKWAAVSNQDCFLYLIEN
jgi:hypothetical protein